MNTPTLSLLIYDFGELVNGKPHQLQVYIYNRTRYFVDYRLKQFRSDTPIIRFVDFDSELGDKILAKMIRENVHNQSLLHL